MVDTFTVNTMSDTDPDPGNDLTLTEAINAADADANGAIINFDPSVFTAGNDTYTLTGGLPGIAGNVTIDGTTSDGAGITLDAAGNGGLVVSSGVVSIENLSIEDAVAIGPAGGNANGGGGAGGGGGGILPVCFKAGSLGENVPARDLWVSPNHAMYFGVANVGWVERSETHHPAARLSDGFRKGSTHPTGLLIEAKDLINGVSIVQADRVETLEYVHIELDSHDVIIAEGALSETFIDDDSRGMFHNAHEFDTLYAEESPAPAHYCAPRLNEGYEVEAVRQRLAQRAGLLRHADVPQLGALRGHIDRIRSTSIAGWAQNADAPEAPVCLDIFADGKLIGQVLANSYRDDLKCAGLGSGCHGFNFIPPVGLVFAPNSVEVRRSLDGVALERSASGAPASHVTPHRRAANG
jgi:hypothetical protein